MKIAKAIEKLNDLTRYSYMPETQDALDALKLGIEALKMIEEGRSKPGGMFFHDLPGETTD